MLEHLIVIYFITVMLGAIPYAAWALYTAFKRRWRQLALQVIAPPMVGFGLFCADILDWHFYGRYAYLQSIFSVRCELGTELYTYDTPRAYNGDGYSFGVFELPPTIRQRFSQTADGLLATFPRRDKDRLDWQTSFWRAAPAAEIHQKYIDFALSDYGSRDTQLHSQFANIRMALNSPHSFYSFFYKASGDDYPNNIDMFVIDLDKGRLYIINHNT